MRPTDARHGHICKDHAKPEEFSVLTLFHENKRENVAFRADDDDDDANEIAPIDRYVCPRIKLEFGRFWYNSA